MLILDRNIVPAFGFANLEILNANNCHAFDIQALLDRGPDHRSGRRLPVELIPSTIHHGLDFHVFEINRHKTQAGKDDCTGNYRCEQESDKGHTLLSLAHHSLLPLTYCVADSAPHWRAVSPVPVHPNANGRAYEHILGDKTDRRKTAVTTVVAIIPHNKK